MKAIFKFLFSLIGFVVFGLLKMVWDGFWGSVDDWDENTKPTMVENDDGQPEMKITGMKKEDDINYY